MNINPNLIYIIRTCSTGSMNVDVDNLPLCLMASIIAVSPTRKPLSCITGGEVCPLGGGAGTFLDLGTGGRLRFVVGASGSATAYCLHDYWCISILHIRIYKAFRMTTKIYIYIIYIHVHIP